MIHLIHAFQIGFACNVAAMWLFNNLRGALFYSCLIGILQIIGRQAQRRSHEH